MSVAFFLNIYYCLKLSQVKHINSRFLGITITECMKITDDCNLFENPLRKQELPNNGNGPNKQLFIISRKCMKHWQRHKSRVSAVKRLFTSKEDHLLVMNSLTELCLRFHIFQRQLQWVFPFLRFRFIYNHFKIKPINKTTS